MPKDKTGRGLEGVVGDGEEEGGLLPQRREAASIHLGAACAREDGLGDAIPAGSRREGGETKRRPCGRAPAKRVYISRSSTRWAFVSSLKVKKKGKVKISLKMTASDALDF